MTCMGFGASGLVTGTFWWKAGPSDSASGRQHRDDVHGFWSIRARDRHVLVVDRLGGCLHYPGQVFCEGDAEDHKGGELSAWPRGSVHLLHLHVALLGLRLHAPDGPTDLPSPHGRRVSWRAPVARRPWRPLAAGRWSACKHWTARLVQW